MKPKTMLLIDQLAYPVYRIVFLWQSLSKKENSTSNPKQSVVIKMMGIGSITRIYETLSGSGVDMNRVCFYTFSMNKELCKVLEIPNVKYINNDSWFSLLKSIWKTLWEIRAQDVHSIVDFERSSNLLGLFRYISTLFKPVGSLSFYNSRKDYLKGKHKVYTLKGRSINNLIELSLAHLPKPAQPSSIKTKNTGAMRGSGNAILININASDYLPLRKYAQAGFAAIIRRLREEAPHLDIHLIGASSEKAYVQAFITKHLPEERGVINQCGQWSLKDLTEQLYKTPLLITNDSGPMHLAVKMNTKLIAIWGPTSPATFGYTDKPHIINIESKRACRPCFTHPKSKAATACNKRIDCMNDIDPEEIVAAAHQLLKKEEVYQ